jgi:small subunit ribosomal protein S6
VHRRVPNLTKYEFTYILDPLVDEAAAEQSLEKYAQLVQDQGGEVLTRENWGRKRLAYEIRHKTEGVYGFIRMKASPAVVAELNRVLRFDEQVLRTLIVVDEDWEARNQEAARRGKPVEAPAPEPAAADAAAAEPAPAEPAS